MFLRRHEIAWFHRDFYRNCYRKTLWWLLASIVVMLGLIGALIYVFLTQPNVPYYASTTTGEVIPLVIKR